MAKISVECPSGMTGEIRNLKVKEADALAGATRRKRHDVVYGVLSSCWETIDSPGPYQFSGDKPDWNRVLQGDISFLLMELRKATFGPIYSFKAQCDNSNCRERFNWDVNLDELPVQPLADEHAQQFSVQNLFETVVDDRKYTFSLPTGATAKRAAKVSSQNRGSRLTFSLQMRIADVEGVHRNDIKRYIEDMDLGHLMDLIDEFDKYDCGVDADIEIECPECGDIQEVPLPLEGEFFFPRRVRKTQNPQQDTNSRAITS